MTKGAARTRTWQAAGTLVALASGAALAASGSAGTEGVAELSLSGPQLLMMLGGAGALGIVLWLVIRALNR